MTYRFEFERKRVFWLTTGIFVFGFLSYAGGVITGIGLWRPTQSELALLRSKDVQPMTVATASAGVPQASVAPQVGVQVAAPALAVQSPVVSPVMSLPGATVSPTLTVPAPVSAPRATKAPEAPVEAAAQPAVATARLAIPGPSPFCLQVGSFEKADGARKLQSDLKDRGYTAFIFDQIDSEQKAWHAVRIGGYPTLTSAAQAAVEFSNKERIQALVRKSNTL
jgi:cell division septation protein DedD